jgi:hypothetical protein
MAKKGKAGGKSAQKKTSGHKMQVVKKAAPKAGKKIIKSALKPGLIVKIKCCSHCPDFEYCEEKAKCCDYCDFFLNAKCTYGKKKGIPSVNQEVELPDYRGDDFGIDDYEAYEPVYE